MSSGTTSLFVCLERGMKMNVLSPMQYLKIPAHIKSIQRYRNLPRFMARIIWFPCARSRELVGLEASRYALRGSELKIEFSGNPIGSSVVIVELVGDRGLIEMS